MAHRRSVSQLKNGMTLDRTAKSLKTELLVHSTHSLGLLATPLALSSPITSPHQKPSGFPGHSQEKTPSRSQACLCALSEHSIGTSILLSPSPPLWKYVGLHRGSPPLLCQYNKSSRWRLLFTSCQPVLSRCDASVPRQRDLWSILEKQPRTAGGSKILGSAGKVRRRTDGRHRTLLEAFIRTPHIPSYAPLRWSLCLQQTACSCISCP